MRADGVRVRVRDWGKCLTEHTDIKGEVGTGGWGLGAVLLQLGVVGVVQPQGTSKK